MRRLIASLFTTMLTVASGVFAQTRAPVHGRTNANHSQTATTPSHPAGTAAASAAPPSPTDVIEVPGFSLSPADRATVRLLAIDGIGAAVARGRSGTTRMVAEPLWGHGTGVVVRADGVILTARHVVEGSDFIAAVFPGQTVAVPAVVLYSDPDHDIAFVQVQTTRPLASVVTLSDAPLTLTSGQHIRATGYPLDASERYPAAAAGEFSRINNDGRLQLAVSLNPGNSGGPVLDADGHLLGIVSARPVETGGQSISGIAVAEPIRVAADVWRSVVQRLPAPTFDPTAARIAQAMFDLVGIDTERAATDTASIERVRALASMDLSPEARCVVGAQAWNEAIRIAETVTPTTITPEQQEQVRQLAADALRIYQQTLGGAPYLRSRYRFGFWLTRINGSLVAPDLLPWAQHERRQ
jgi:S1-C subfamily serine protease